MSYKSHVVVKTLDLCRFSLIKTTGQRFIYTGCGTGRVVIYDSLTGEMMENNSKHDNCVRDVDWHPHRNEILSSSKVDLFTYYDSDLEQSEDGDLERMISDLKTPPPLRRSVRLAMKRLTRR